MPDDKYFYREKYGVGKFSLGMDNEDYPSTAPKSVENEKLKMPTTKTQDVCKWQDGSVKPWKPKGR